MPRRFEFWVAREHRLHHQTFYERDDALRCETRHVDGQHNALNRKARIEWLKGDADGTARILSNARCLSEGIDVPALDAVLLHRRGAHRGGVPRSAAVPTALGEKSGSGR